MTNPRRLWEAILGELQVQVNRSSFNAILKDTVGLALEADCLVVGTPKPLVAEYLEKRMYTLIQKTAERLMKRSVELRFEAISADGDQQSASEEQASAPPPTPRETPHHSPLNPRYTFSSFIVGRSNEMAHAAAVAAAERPGHRDSPNPLFLYAGVGLGKTHLLHAIGHRAVEKGLTMAYASTEQFTNEFIAAIRQNRTDEFRQHYRSVEMLLIDDIQFLIGKEQTQEGFFHTFNELHNANHQIVITSDRPPKSLTLLEDRLRSRFEWGLIADIQPPDLETRLAILRAKADLLHATVPQEVQEYIGRPVQRSIRELEGKLNRVVAFAQLTQRPITLDLAALALADLVNPRAHKPPLPDAIIAAVAHHYDIPREVLLGRRRDKQTALARQVAMYLLREEAHRPLTDIGRLLGGKDHSTVMHACKKIQFQMNLDTSLRNDILSLKERLQNTGEGSKIGGSLPTQT
ncbi:MAG: chromosomal replication initiator protein DnaA [Chloroflexi bacterium]|nr:chromosomal replication initiator protein DnaA [Chloroflexota bacterium]